MVVSIVRIALLILIGVSIAACNDESLDSSTAPTTSIPAAANAAPMISGSPGTEAKIGEAYFFQPAATDADGDTLTFHIINQPPWGSFNSSTGVLSGTPSAADLGTTSNISISVSDGQAETSLAPFLIAVVDVAMGSVTLSWMPPTENDDGSTLTDLSGYRILWGTSSEDLDNTITIDNPGLSSYTIENLVPRTYYFALVATNSAGIDSEPSNVVPVELSTA